MVKAHGHHDERSALRPEMSVLQETRKGCQAAMKDSNLSPSPTQGGTDDEGLPADVRRLPRADGEGPVREPHVPALGQLRDPARGAEEEGALPMTDPECICDPSDYNPVTKMGCPVCNPRTDTEDGHYCCDAWKPCPIHSGEPTEDEPYITVYGSRDHPHAQDDEHVTMVRVRVTPDSQRVAIGWVVVCRNRRTGEVHHIASGPKHMDPWQQEYAEEEACRLHHNDDWLDCTAEPVGHLVSTPDSHTEPVAWAPMGMEYHEEGPDTEAGFLIKDGEVLAFDSEEDCRAAFIEYPAIPLYRRTEPARDAKPASEGTDNAKEAIELLREVVNAPGEFSHPTRAKIVEWFATPTEATE